jgi:prepilin-type processing-associated H-X9-DG protein
MGPVVNPEPFRKAGTIPFGDETLARANPLTMTVDVFSCPALVDTEFVKNIRDGAYGYNYQYLGNTRMETNLIRWDNFAVRLHEIKAPSRTVTLADSRGAGPKHGPHSFTLDPPRLATEQNAKRFGPNAEDTGIEAQMYSPVENRHVGRANVVFADAHGESTTLEDLGYEVSDGANYPNHKRGEPVPILKPQEGPYKASNQLWNGKGIDEVAAKANVPP